MTGLIAGLLIGFVLQRGRFDPAAAFQSWYRLRETELLRTYVGVLLVQAAVVFGARILLNTAVSAEPYRWLASALGGALLGAGMAVAGGGVAASLAQAGSGSASGLVASLGFVIGAASAAGGGARLVHGARSFALEGAGSLPGIPYQVVALGFLSAAAWWLWKGFRPVRLRYERLLREPWPWFLAAAATGLVWLMAAGKLTVGASGALRFLAGEQAAWKSAEWLVLGIPLGAWAGARLSGERQESYISANAALRTLAGGVMMGFGSVMAGGDDLTVSMAAGALLSLDGITALAAMLLGLWGATCGLDLVRFIRTPIRIDLPGRGR